MTKQEIAALVAAKIEGQGTNVDAGSVLPAILNGILDLIPAAPVPPTPADIFAGFSVTTDLDQAAIVSGSGTGLSKGQAAQALGITGGDLDALLSGKIVRFVYGGGSVAVGSQTPASVSMGDDAFSIVIAYDSDAGTYDVTATAA